MNLLIFILLTINLPIPKSGFDRKLPPNLFKANSVLLIQCPDDVYEKIAAEFLGRCNELGIKITAMEKYFFHDTPPVWENRAKTFKKENIKIAILVFPADIITNNESQFSKDGEEWYFAIHSVNEEGEIQKKPYKIWATIDVIFEKLENSISKQF